MDAIQSNVRNEALRIVITACIYRMQHFRSIMRMRKFTFKCILTFRNWLYYACSIIMGVLIRERIYIKILIFRRSARPTTETFANRMISISSLGVFVNDPCLTMQSINRNGQRSGISLYCLCVNSWPCCRGLDAMCVTYRIVPDGFKSP